MAVPRPILLTLLGTVLLAVTFMAMRNSQGASENTAQPAKQAQQPSAPAPAPQPAKGGNLSAQEAVRAVLSPGAPVRSARFGLRLQAKELGGKRRLETASVVGRFDRGAAAGGVPGFEMSAREVDDGKPYAVRVSSVGGQGYFSRGGETYRLSGATFRNTGRVRKALTPTGSRTAKLPALDPAGWTKDVEASAGPKVGGVETTRVSGRIAPELLVKQIKAAVKTAGAGAGRAPQLPRGVERGLRRGLADARFVAHVGTQDKIARRVRLAVTGSVPRPMLERGETARWRTVLDLRLADVNQPQKVEAPKDVASRQLKGRPARNARGTFFAAAIAMDPPANALQLGIGMARLQRIGAATRTPRAVSRAIRANKRVVIFFGQSNGLDDPLTAESVRALRARSKASIFADSVDNVAAYREIVQGAGVTRAPSVVIIGRDEKARLIEGYVDPETLAQEVADTR